MIRAILLSALGALTLSACAERPPRIAYDDPRPARLQADPPRPVEVVTVPEPLPLPGQLKPLPPRGRVSGGRDARDPVERVRLANVAAAINPTRAGYINAMQVFPYDEGALYQIYATPVHVTDIALEPGEALRSVAAGDTVQWKIGDTRSGAGASQQAHVLIKPVAADLPMNNLVILTDRRTYHLEVHPTVATYMAAVAWRYPRDQLLALQARNDQTNEQAESVAAEGVDLAALRFRYRIAGDAPPWRPVQVFDDGAKVYIQFPAGIAEGEMPPLFVVGTSGQRGELVNYRVRGATMIVDRLFAVAELRLGVGPQQVVTIRRTDGVRG
ncbi:P-type conjugative transfer protein TrbG [Nguyenibacter vanlangensis]|uniref:P-type conjugative transfer protein TrbG n=1 Tax=Nguyenibacter vanlangensis TaxID=1216886 RepID=A0ABZ3D9P3_9PROT